MNNLNKFINTLKKGRKEETKENYPWLDPSNERKYMTDRENIRKIHRLRKILFNRKEKKEVMDMLYQYKEAINLRDEIDTCPNIEVEINAMHKSPFFIRPKHVKEDDKNFIDKEMKCLFHLAIIKEGFSAYSSPVMLISRKLTPDKRVLTDFRHLNIRVAKNNLAYPQLKDTFSVLGSTRCEVLSVLDLEDAFNSLRLLENSKRYCGISPYFGSTSYLYQRMPMGIKYLTLNLAIIYKCYIRLFTEQKILWSNYG